MKILIDNADIQEIKKAYEYFPITGVTCNPTILKRTGRNPYDVLKEIREFIGADGDLHVQVVSAKAEDMVVEAHKIQEVLGKNTYIKIPVVREGLKAMKLLHAEGANITGTAIYNQMQGYLAGGAEVYPLADALQDAYLAGMAGAAYVAPYVNRIDNLGYNGVQVAKDIHDMLKHAGLKTEVIAASFKNSQQVLELAKYGLGASTIAPDVIEGLIKVDAAVLAVDAFTRDFEELCGEGNTMLNI